MKLLGSVLILWAAGQGWLCARRWGREPLELAEALLEDLSILKSRVCTGQIPLPRILEEELIHGFGAVALWEPLRYGLRGEESAPLPELWQKKTAALPSTVGRVLAPLGPLLSEGGVNLGRAIDETREELARYIRAQRQKQTAADRVSAALCISGALLVILVLI